MFVKLPSRGTGFLSFVCKEKVVFLVLIVSFYGKGSAEVDGEG